MYVHRCCRKTVHHLWHCLVKYNDKTWGHRGTTLLVSLRAPTVNFFFSDASALASVHFLHPNKAGSGIPDTLIQWNRFSVAPLGILIHFLFFFLRLIFPFLLCPIPVPFPLSFLRSLHLGPTDPSWRTHHLTHHDDHYHHLYPRRCTFFSPQSSLLERPAANRC